MAEQPDNWSIIIRYISGEATAKDQREVEDRINADPNFKAIVDDLQKIWASSAESKKTWDVDEAWDRYTKEFGNPYEDRTAKTTVINSINDARKQRSSKHHKQNSAVRSAIYRFGIIAAAAAASILLVFLFYGPQKTIWNRK